MNILNRRFWLSLHGFATILMMAAALYFLLVEHGEHVYPALPYLVLLMCPLMHIFMHKSHGSHHRHRDTADKAERRGLEEGRRSQ